MTKRIALVLMTLILISTLSTGLMLTASAEHKAAPEWIITEVGADTQGNDQNTNGYTADISKDCFEFIEIYNNSGRELNLYDYAITFSNSKRNTPDFEYNVQRYTPFLPGNYLDDATLEANTGDIGDLSNMPVNPDTCLVAPGETVVLWMVYYEAYLAMFNDGKGMSMADFRAHWSIPEDVKVIAVDGNGNSSNGGNPKNFNVVNSGCGTYGIVLQNEAMEQTANVADGIFEGEYTENPDMIFWVSLDYDNVIIYGEMANRTMNFTWDFAGYACKDQSATDYAWDDYTYDSRRAYLLSACDTPTPGALNVLQKMTLGIELKQGESYELLDDCMYWPILEESVLGFKINGVFYEGETTFTAEQAGVYTFDYFLASDQQTTELTTEQVTEQVTEQQTEQVTDPVQEPTQEPTETAPEQQKNGCGAVLGAALLPCLALAGVAFMKKRR